MVLNLRRASSTTLNADKLRASRNLAFFTKWKVVVQVFEERAYLVGIDKKGAGGRALFGIQDSLEELAQLADTAGLTVVGSTYQK
jgi:hypothetical protein